MTWIDIEKAYDYLYSIGAVHTQKEFASKIGKTPETVSKNMGTDRKASASTILKLKESFPNMFSEDWLLRGEGEMLQASQKPQEATKSEWDITNQEGVIKLLMEQNKMFMQMILDNEEYRKKHDAKVDEELSELRGILLRLIKQEYGVATYHDTSLVNDEVKVYDKK